MEFKLGKANIAPRNALFATGAAIAAVAFSGCGDSHKEPILIPSDATEVSKAGNDKVFLMDDSEINREVFNCGKRTLDQLPDDGPNEIEFSDSNMPGKIFGVCLDVGLDWPVKRLAGK